MLAFARKIILIGAIMGLTACSSGPMEQRTLMVFGTLVEVMAATDDASAFSDAMSEIEQRFQTMHRDLHAWKPGMLVDLNNAIANGETFCVSDEIAELIRRSAEFEQLTGGRFNAAIGKLVGMWGFHTDEPVQGRAPPSFLDIAKVLEAKPSASDLSIDERNCVTSSNPMVALDFGGIAKGHAVNVAIDILRKHRIENALVNAGGDLRVIGMKHGRPWHIGIKNPFGEGAIGELDVLEDESVFTSGNYERFNDYEGVRYAHIIDPSTGRPVMGVASATVVHPDAVLADAVATAMVVAGVTRWKDLVAAFKLRQAMLVDEDGQIHTTTPLRERMKASRK
ncbi:MAG: FAD:protein FMN transferase [Chromatiales bacterium]|nr:FAD:protein FMN transferase [Gammaproteobacteria bacterium]MCP5352265.1 FAD:protein FMN transferase [Chromatiales bacterium]